jgi:THO complex subunit 3
MNKDFGTYSASNVTSMQQTKLVEDLKWNVDGSYLGVVSSVKNVKIGQLEGSVSMKCVHTVPITTFMSMMCWHPTEPARFALCGDDKNIEIWDVRSSRPTQKLPTSGRNLNMSWSPDANYLAVANQTDVISILDVRMVGSVKKIVRFPYMVNELQWTANSDFILSATGEDNNGRIDLTATTGTGLILVETLAAHPSRCRLLKIDPMYRRMAVSDMESLLSLWDIDDLICHHSVSFDSEVRCLSYSGDGQYLVASTEDPIMAIINSDTGDIVNKIITRYRVSSLAWHPTSPTNLIATAMDDRSPAPVILKFVTFPNSM